MVGAAAIIAWSIVTIGLVFGFMKLIGKLRVPEEIEIRGYRCFAELFSCYLLLCIYFKGALFSGFKGALVA